MQNLFPSLETLHLVQCDQIAMLWSRECPTSIFQNLKDIDIYNCKGLQGLGPPSMFAALVHLHELKIKSCPQIRDVITKETAEDVIRERIIVFPQLKTLKLSDLYNLESFYKGSCKLKFPNLKQLVVSTLSRMSKFVESEISNALFDEKVQFYSILP